jgi:predicted PurR-regulated permease PerM
MQEADDTVYDFVNIYRQLRRYCCVCTVVCCCVLLLCVVVVCCVRILTHTHKITNTVILVSIVQYNNANPLNHNKFPAYILHQINEKILPNLFENGQKGGHFY